MRKILLGSVLAFGMLTSLVGAGVASADKGNGVAGGPVGVAAGGPVGVAAGGPSATQVSPSAPSAPKNTGGLTTTNPKPTVSGISTSSTETVATAGSIAASGQAGAAGTDGSAGSASMASNSSVSPGDGSMTYNQGASDGGISHVQYAVD